MPETAILGAGLAGLGCAQNLPSAKIFEAKDHPGGHAYSHELAGVHFDEGAHISHTKDEAFLARMLEHAGEVHTIAPSVVSNYWHGEWLKYPVQNHLHCLSVEHRVPALTDLVMAQLESHSGEPANYREWCLRQYGTYLTEHFYKVFTDKYWRTRMEDLSTDWLGGRLLPSVIPNIIRGAIHEQAEKQAAFTTFRYPARGGFFRLFAHQYEDLDIEYGQRAVELDLTKQTIRFESGDETQYEQLASSIPLPRLVGLIHSAPASIRTAAGALRHTRLLCVNMIIDRPDLSANHWLYVYDEDIPGARISFPSNLAPGSAGPDRTALQVEVFRRDDEPFHIEELTAKVCDTTARMLGFEHKNIVAMQPVPVEYAYIVSDHARANAVQHILDWLTENGIYSMGLYGRWQYLWSDAAYSSGVETAAQIKGARA